MSGEQPAIKASHSRPAEPFLSEITLQQLRADMIDGFLEVHKAMHEHTRLMRQEMVQLREDLAPRVTKVEQTQAANLAAKAKTAAGWTGVISLALTIAAQVAAMYRPQMVGPLQSIAQMFGGGGP